MMTDERDFAGRKETAYRAPAFRGACQNVIVGVGVWVWMVEQAMWCRVSKVPGSASSKDTRSARVPETDTGTGTVHSLHSVPYIRASTSLVSRVQLSSMK